MCTVSIDIDETAIRDLRPELDTTAAIRLWAQELIDLRLQQMQMEDEETMDVEELRAMSHETVRKEYACDRAESRRQALKRDMTPEQLYSLISEEIDEIYAKG
jgi:hypothetical protein